MKSACLTRPDSTRPASVARAAVLSPADTRQNGRSGGSGCGLTGAADRA